ncbi:precorrin-6A synthase (deacetylating) [Nocardia sp. CA2R105]|uniref:precorrin-6A synthase (deacetylating) n=1 Tax=Nocardia coffeae TaxID=2873381 RepID=UPI001CA5FFB8|nr:precorrin-6A synthase (deacetylating) [Nocardia coffeae]MBY8857830.1 precorrin-6A synthase (deacetylating) [Nocardia coffeae]
MRKLYVIGIGAGDPDQVTVQAVKAMRRAEVFYVIGKGEAKRELVEVRTAILAEHMDREYRIVEIADPPRERTVADGEYRDVVLDWHERRAALLGEAFAEYDGVGAILVWGDPSLYDSTLRMIERVDARTPLDYEVIPGVTSAQALAARHRIVLHEIGEPVHITTGRRLREEGLLPGVPTVVMLDGETSFTGVPGDDVHIWWGAYLGMPDEELIEGPLRAVESRILQRRNELRENKGWIMDIYLLRREVG